MDFTIERIIPIEDGIRALKASVLEEAGGEEIHYYKDATIRLAEFRPEEVNPVSIYLLRKNLDFQRQLRGFLLKQTGIDTLQMTEIVHLGTPKGIIGLSPPYVEISEETLSISTLPGDRPAPTIQKLRIPIFVDGLHRAWLARELGMTLNCVVSQGGDPAYPYGAYPASWDEVKLYDEVPPVKKYYRRQDKYGYMRCLDALRLTGKAAEKEYGR